MDTDMCPLEQAGPIFGHYVPLAWERLGPLWTLWVHLGRLGPLWLYGNYGSIKPIGQARPIVDTMGPLGQARWCRWGGGGRGGGNV